MNLLLGIDIGTTSTKAVVVDTAGQLLAQASQEYATDFPRPNWAEQDPEDWWRATCSVINRLWSEQSIDPHEIAALAVSCQAPTVTPVDAAGRPLSPAQLWMDRRAGAECAWLHENVGEEAITRSNGGRIDPYYLAPKWLWLREHAPAVYRATHKLLFANGYIIHKLTGEFCIDLSHGPLTLFFDSATLTWSPSLLAAMGLNADHLPPLLPCSQVAGVVTPAAVALTGLRAGTPVMAGMTDGTAAGLEAGLVRPGDAVEMTGQSTVLLICSDQPYLGRELIPLGHAAPGAVLDCRRASRIGWGAALVPRPNWASQSAARLRACMWMHSICWRSKQRPARRAQIGLSFCPTCTASARQFGTATRAVSSLGCRSRRPRVI
jgi:xylulokinase